MAERIGVCTQCGSKFKIPSTFKGTKAKCKKCGGVVKIPPLGAAEEHERPARPSAEKVEKKPGAAAAAARAKAGKAEAAGKGARKAPSRSSVSSRYGKGRGGRAATGRRRAGSSRRGRKGGEEEGENKKWIWIVAGVSVVAIVVICIFLFGGGGEEPAPTTSTPAADTAQAPAGPAVKEEAPAKEPEPEPEPEKPAEPEPEVPSVVQEKPKEINPVIKFEPFPPIEGGDPKRFERLTACLRDGILKEDLPRFKRRTLEKEFKEALNDGTFDVVPVLLNAFNGINLLNRNDVAVAFQIADMWNKFTARGFTDVPVRGDVQEEMIKKNLEWNAKAINSLIFDVWAPKVGNAVKQQEFFKKIETARAKEKERAEKEKQGEGG